MRRGFWLSVRIVVLGPIALLMWPFDQLSKFFWYLEALIPTGKS